MPNYKEMYHNLFNAMTDAINILQKAQLHTENNYIESSQMDSLEKAKFRIVEKEEK